MDKQAEVLKVLKNGLTQTLKLSKPGPMNKLPTKKVGAKLLPNVGTRMNKVPENKLPMFKIANNNKYLEKVAAKKKVDNRPTKKSMIQATAISSAIVPGYVGHRLGEDHGVRKLAKDIVHPDSTLLHGVGNYEEHLPKLLKNYKSKYGKIGMAVGAGYGAGLGALMAHWHVKNDRKYK